MAGACAKTEDTQQPVASMVVTPARPAAEAGAPLDFIYRFARIADAPALSNDHWVFVHMVDQAGTLLWTDDHRPDVPPAAWGAKPVTYRRTMFVPRMASAGRVRVEAGLYVPADGKRVALTGEQKGDRSYPVTSFDVLPPSNGLFVSFGNGWHGAERAPQEPMREWRWTTGNARLSFRHPGREVTLWLELDQPVVGVGRQHVEVRKEGALLAALPIAPGTRSVSRVAVPSAQGAGPIDLDVTVEPTFVPAAMPSLSSQDTRELGVRVFNVYVGAR